MQATLILLKMKYSVLEVVTVTDRLYSTLTTLHQCIFSVAAFHSGYKISFLYFDSEYNDLTLVL